MNTEKLLARISQIAATVAGLFLSSLSCPVSLVNWPKLVLVCVYILALITVRSSKTWRIALFACLAIGLFFGFIYWLSLDSKSVTIEGKTYVKGQLIEDAKKYIRENPSVTEQEYFAWSGKKQNEVWTSESLLRNKLILGGLYSLFVAFTGFGILGGLEIIAKRKAHVSSKTT